MHRAAGGGAESNSPHLPAPHSPAPEAGARASTAHSRSVPTVRSPARPRGSRPCAGPRVVSPWWKPRAVCLYTARPAPPRPAPTSKMVALHCGGGLRPLMLSWSRDLPCIWRALHTSAVCFKVSAAWGLAASGSGTWGWGHDLGLVLGQWSRKVTASLFRTGRPESEWARGTNQ